MTLVFLIFHQSQNFTSSFGFHYFYLLICFILFFFLFFFFIIFLLLFLHFFVSLFFSKIGLAVLFFHSTLFIHFSGVVLYLLVPMSQLRCLLTLNGHIMELNKRLSSLSLSLFHYFSLSLSLPILRFIFNLLFPLYSGFYSEFKEVQPLEIQA